MGIPGQVTQASSRAGRLLAELAGTSVMSGLFHRQNPGFPHQLWKTGVFGRGPPSQPAFPQGMPRAGSRAQALISARYSLRFERSAKYSRASLASRWRSFESKIAFRTILQAALGRK